MIYRKEDEERYGAENAVESGTGQMSAESGAGAESEYGLIKGTGMSGMGMPGAGASGTGASGAGVSGAGYGTGGMREGSGVESVYEENVGAAPGTAVIGQEEVDRAYGILQEYKDGKAALEARVISNEEWWKQHNSHYDKNGKPVDGENTAWLFNSVANKHADAMDNKPCCNILAREKDDEKTAATLSSIIPVILDRNRFTSTYSECWYDKLIGGAGIYAVQWDSSLLGGLGDVSINRVDLLNFFWAPGVSNIQQSPNVFLVELWDNEVLKSKYPELADSFSPGSTVDVSKYVTEDYIDTAKKSLVVDWYYKKLSGSRTVVHYCKMCNGKLLYSSENTGQYERGYYIGGQYPFVFDRLYFMKGSPCGFSQVDITKGTQNRIDALTTYISENARLGAKRRFFVNAAGNVNEEEFADASKQFVHFTGSGNPNESIMPIDIPQLSGIYAQILEADKAELKETSGNNDWSQGGTTSGVTAASAIAALQEAGSKLSRDMINQSYSAYEQVVLMIIERIRQFYDEPRTFRIIGAGAAAEYISFSAADGMRGRNQGEIFGEELGEYEPIFDVKVKAQKESPFSRMSSNSLGVQFYQMGIFAPQNADTALAMLDMMEFDGKDSVIEKINKNSQIPQLQDTVMSLATELCRYDARFTPMLSQLAQQFGINMQAMQGAAASAADSGSASSASLETNALGEAMRTSKATTAATAAQRASEMASLK